jgi:dTDP-4-dehydrorhamnose 3,5-epimerase-like enzyme
MTGTRDEEPRLISIPVVRDPRGALAVIDCTLADFKIQRVYFLYDIDSNSARGSHAHRELRQLIVAVSGSFRVSLDDGIGNFVEFEMRDPQTALIVPPGHWRRIYDFSHASVCLVLASEQYDEADYIRDYDAFLSWKRSK